MELCYTCKHWGPTCYLLESSKKVRAQCNYPCWLSKFTYQDHTCPHWVERPGEPLGLGLKQWCFLRTDHPFFPAAIVHDLRYEDLKPGESTAGIDLTFLHHCWGLATNPWRKMEAVLYYTIVRTYGALHI